MKAFIVLFCIAALMVGAYFLHPHLSPRAPVQPWSETRAWKASDGRAFTGRLVAGMNGEGVFMRQDDGRLFRIKPSALAPADADMLATALGHGALARRLDGVYHLKRRLEIPGQQASVHPVGAVHLGPRIAKSDADYWLFLTELDGGLPQWVRVDGDAYRRFRNDTLLTRSELANFTRGGGFHEAMSWPRPELLLVEAKYGLSARRIDATRTMMKLISNGQFPQELGPDMFGLPPHHPDVWDLVLTWVKSDGSMIYRTVRDGQVVTWP